MAAESPIALIYGSDGSGYIETSIRAGIAVPSGQPGFMALGSDGTNSRYIKVSNTGVLIVDGSAVTQPVSGTFWQATQPVSVASLPLPSGAATESTLATLLTLAGFQARIPVNGQAVMSASIPVTIASNQSVLPINDNAGSLTVDSPQLPSSLVGGRLDANVGAWLGSTAPTVGQKTMANSVPVALASDQAAIPVSQSGTWTVQPGNTANTTPWLIDLSRVAGTNTITGGVAGSLGVGGLAASGASAAGNPVYIGGIDGSTARGIAVDSSGRIITSPAGAASPTRGFIFGAVPTTGSTQIRVEATTYTEQTSNAQRSLVSTSANDTSAGTGARTVKITYLKSDGTGPFTETVTMNGTTAVNTVATDICFIETMEVLTVGSNGTNVGTINLKATTGGGGATVGSIGTGTMATGGDGRTLWAHHYVPTGKTMHITGVTVGHGKNTSQGSGGVFHLKSLPIGGSDSIEQQVTDFIHQFGQASSTPRIYATPIDIAGPARVTAFVLPDASLTVVYLAAWDFYED